MPARSRRPEIIAAYEGILTRYGAPDITVLALELVQAAEGRGIDFDRPALIDDPVAADWRPELQPAPGNATAGLAALRQAAGLDPKDTE